MRCLLAVLCIWFHALHTVVSRSLQLLLRVCWLFLRHSCYSLPAGLFNTRFIKQMSWKSYCSSPCGELRWSGNCLCRLSSGLPFLLLIFFRKLASYWIGLLTLLCAFFPVCMKKSVTFMSTCLPGPRRRRCGWRWWAGSRVWLRSSGPVLTWVLVLGPGASGEVPPQNQSHIRPHPQCKCFCRVSSPYCSLLSNKVSLCSTPDRPWTHSIAYFCFPDMCHT